MKNKNKILFCMCGWTTLCRFENYIFRSPTLSFSATIILQLLWSRSIFPLFLVAVYSTLFSHDKLLPVLLLFFASTFSLPVSFHASANNAMRVYVFDGYFAIFHCINVSDIDYFHTQFDSFFVCWRSHSLLLVPSTVAQLLKASMDLMLMDFNVQSMLRA